MTQQRMTTKLFIVFIIIAGVVAFWPPARRFVFGSHAPAQQITVSGNIEAHESLLSFNQVQGLIDQLPFDEGKFVSAGTVLAHIDDRPYRQQLQIDQANVAVQDKQIAVNESNLAASQNTVLNDQLDLAEKKREAIRDRAQLTTGAISQLNNDLSSTAAAQAQAVLARDRALLRVAHNNVGMSRASLNLAEAKVRLDAITLAYTTLKAPFSGVLAVREAELGELAGPGVAIFTLDDLRHVWLRAYVNETDLGKIRLNEAASVTTDTYPGKAYHGRIGFISAQAEFTPKTVETHAERVSLVYRIRIDIDNPTFELLPGMPANATIALLPSGK